jgi:N-acetyltransferase 10
MYAQNLVDYHLVIDMVPEMAKLYFTGKLGEEFNLSIVQSVGKKFFSPIYLII